MASAQQIITINNDRPAYRILGQWEGPDSHLYQDGDLVYWTGEPNEEMEALNEPAKAAMTAFFEKLEDFAKKNAEAAGREYTGRPRSIEDAIALSHADARRVSTVKGDGGIPVMGAIKKDTGVERIQPQQDEDGSTPTQLIINKDAGGGNQVAGAAPKAHPGGLKTSPKGRGALSI